MIHFNFSAMATRTTALLQYIVYMFYLLTGCANTMTSIWGTRRKF